MPGRPPEEGKRAGRAGRGESLERGIPTAFLVGDTGVEMNASQGGRTMIHLDLNTRAGRMMEAGRITVTFRSTSTGQHITLLAKARTVTESGKWVACGIAAAKIIFIEVPNEDGFNDKVGKITRAKGFVPAAGADEARAFCAKQLIRFLAGQDLPAGLEAHEESRCGACGRQLTDPVSIERGIGPECYGRATGSKHQTKIRPEPPAPTEKAATSEDLPTANDLAVEHAGDARMYGEVFGDGPGDSPLGFTAPSKASDGKDKQGVAFGHGNWRGRKKEARRAIREHVGTEKMDALLKGKTPGESQMQTLPGETWEDIFRGRATEMGLELR